MFFDERVFLKLGYLVRYRMSQSISLGYYTCYN